MNIFQTNNARWNLMLYSEYMDMKSWLSKISVFYLARGIIIMSWNKQLDK